MSQHRLYKKNCNLEICNECGKSDSYGTGLFINGNNASTINSLDQVFAGGIHLYKLRSIG